METCYVPRTFESVDKNLWYNHLNKSSSAVVFFLLIYFYFLAWYHFVSNILQNVNWDFSRIQSFGTRARRGLRLQH